MPEHVAVVTSPTGAALKDVLSVWRRRFPALGSHGGAIRPSKATTRKRDLYALERAAALQPDVILLTRGGGSMEDLWVFNAESIARAIADIETPIVSAIGHEIDVSISDFVADLRAPTPSAAAELIAPDGEELAQIRIAASSPAATHANREPAGKTPVGTEYNLGTDQSRALLRARVPAT